MNLIGVRQLTYPGDSRPHSGIGDTMYRRPFHFEFGTMSETFDLDSSVCITIPVRAIAAIRRSIWRLGLSQKSIEIT
jgi:hypothetical protein